MKVYVWPDYSWCFAEEYDESFGDDYIKLKIPDCIEDMEDIDEYVINSKCQG